MKVPNNHEAPSRISPDAMNDRLVLDQQARTTGTFQSACTTIRDAEKERLTGVKISPLADQPPSPLLGEVGSQMEVLNASLKQVEEQVVELYERLEAVLRPPVVLSSSEECDKPEENQIAPLAELIRKQKDRIHVLKCGLADIINRLEC